MKRLTHLLFGAAIVATQPVTAQFWAANGNHIYNTNSGDVQIIRSLVLNGNQTGFSEIRFGSSTGEIISSKRTATGNQFGLDFYTNSKQRIALTNNGSTEFMANDTGYSLLRFGAGSDEIISSKRTAGGNQFGLDFSAGGGYFTFNIQKKERIRINNVGDLEIGMDNANNGTATLGALRFGLASGEAIASKRTVGGNRFGLDFYTNSINRMSITQNGNVGIGTASPSKKLQVNGDTRLTSSSGSRRLEFFRPGSDSNQIDFRLDHNGRSLFVTTSENDFVGICNVARFGNCSDVYQLTVYGNAYSYGNWVSSDAKLKKNVDDVSNAMSIIRQLKPKSYFFKNGDNLPLNLPETKQYGFIAQELEKVLPSLVQNANQPVGTNAKGEEKAEAIKAINYTALIPILTQAMQEQQQVIEKQQAQIDELRQMVSALGKGAPAADNAAYSNSAATLEQNNPNPFSNSTSIRYNVPAEAKGAQLMVTDNTGKTIKQVTLNKGKGVVNLDASLFSSGSYYYTLVVDGKKIETKQMLLAK